MAAAVSPSSSPRLPSPPPIAEDQVGPTSPGLPLLADHGGFPVVGVLDSGASRRIRPGTKAADMTDGPPLVELQDIDSPFQLTEHLKALHHTYTDPEGSDSTQAITADVAKQLTQPPASTSKDIWLYELGRFLIQRTNAIIVALFADQPACSAQTCPEMRASEWQYLCAVHDPPKSCAAIDYCCHTLDWAATTLTSSKMFPSRLGLGSGSGGTGLGGSDKVLQQQMKEIKNIFRRVYRIYAHAWFQHREIFWRVESKTGLYVFFKMVCDEYGIIESENYTIPPEAEGAEPSPTPTQTSTQAPSVLKRDPQVALRSGEEEVPEPAGQKVLSLGETTKRHRHTMSDRSASISTVIQEEIEEEEEEVSAPSLQPSLARSSTIFLGSETVTTGTEVTAEEDEPEVEDDEQGRPELVRKDTVKVQTPSEEILAPVEDETVGEHKPEIEPIGDGVAEEEEQAESPATLELPTVSAPPSAAVEESPAESEA